MYEGRKRRNLLTLFRVRPVLVFYVYRLKDIVKQSIIFGRITVVLSIDIIHISIVVAHQRQSIIPLRHLESEKVFKIRRENIDILKIVYIQVTFFIDLICVAAFIPGDNIRLRIRLNHLSGAVSFHKTHFNRQFIVELFRILDIKLQIRIVYI